jgi:CO/xanthine dehydrogenase Mo-binding subunit
MHDLTPSDQVAEHASAQVTLSLDEVGPVATVTCALADTGTGAHAFLRRVVREVLGVDRVAVHQPADPGRLPCSSAPRHPLWVFGGAVERAARAVLAQAVRRFAASTGMSPELFAIRDGEVVSYDGMMRRPLSAVLAAAAPRGTVLYAKERFIVGGPAAGNPPPEGTAGQDRFTVAPDEAVIALAAQRAVVDVDSELGIVRVVDLAVAHEVGRAVCGDIVAARVERGVAAGVGLAVIEAVPPQDLGDPRNSRFGAARGETDDESELDDDAELTLAGYPVLTTLDQPSVRVVELFESSERAAVPLGVKPVGELAVAGAPGAVLAAIRDATGIGGTSLPVRPSMLVPATT